MALSSLTVTTVAASQYTIDLSGVTAVSGSYVLTISASGSGIVDLAAALPMTDDSTDSFEVDVDPPTADIVDVSPDPAASGIGVVTIGFPEPVTGVDIGDFSLFRDASAVSLAPLGVVQVSSTEYSIDLTAVTVASGSYELRLNALGSEIVDAAGNPLVADATETFDVDGIAPMASITEILPDPRNSAVGIVPVVFTEDVTGVDIGDFILTRDGQTVSLVGTNLSQTSGQAYSLDLSTVTESDGNYELGLLATGSGIVDSVGNGLATDAVDNFAIDATNPTADVVDLSPDPANASIAAATVTFSEDVSGVGIDDFELLLNGVVVDLSGLVVSEVAPDEYSLPLSTVTGAEGDYQLTLISANSGIVDAVGNPLLVDATDSFATDLTAPTASIASIDPTNVGIVTVDFDEAVSGVEIGDFTLQLDGTAVDVSSLTVNEVTPTRYTFDISGIVSGPGVWSLTLLSTGTGIMDTAGNFLSADASETFTIEDTDSPHLRIGVVNASTTGWTTINLDHSYSSMVVVATVVNQISGPPIVARVNGGGAGDSFDLRLDRADGQSGPFSTDVHYIVVEEGVYTVAEHGVEMEALVVTSTTTDHKSSWVGQNIASSVSNNYLTPVVLGQVLTYNDSNWSAFWSRGANAVSPPTATDLFVGKMVAGDSNQNRANEELGIILFEAATGSLDGVDFVADVGNDSIDGMPGNGGSYSIGLPNPLVAIASQVAMDGNDGGWAVLHGPAPLASGLDLAIDEDTIQDAERAHTHEQVAYVVFNASTPPTADILDVLPDPVATAVGPVTIQFSESVTGFDVSDLTLTRDGTIIDISSLIVVQEAMDRYTIDLQTVTAVGGTYELRLVAASSDITNLVATPLDIDAVDTFFADIP